MIISTSSSFPDLSASNSTNPTTRHRIPRKPAPTIDIDIIAERYPSPDPLDPFAPLWALRNRTSSILPATGQSISPYSGGKYDSQETLANLVEDERRRRRAYSFNMLSSPYSEDDTVLNGDSIILQPDVLGDTESFTLSGSNLPSPLASPVKATPPPKTKASKTSTKSKGPSKKGHYTPYSQREAHTRIVSNPEASPSPTTAHAHPHGTTTLLQAFPRLSTHSLLLPHHLQTHISPSSDQGQTQKQNPRRVPIPVHKNNSCSDTDTDSTFTNSKAGVYVGFSPSSDSSSSTTQHNNSRPVIALIRPRTAPNASGGSSGNGSGWWFSRSKSSNLPSTTTVNLDVDAEPIVEAPQKYRRSQSALGQLSTVALAHSQTASPQAAQSPNPKHTPGQGQGTPSKKFTKFLKISFLRNGAEGSVGGEKDSNSNDRVNQHDSPNKRPSTDPGLHSTSRPRPRLRPVSKASISSPQAVVDTTVFWDYELGRYESTSTCIRGEITRMKDEMDVKMDVLEAEGVPAVNASHLEAEGDGAEMVKTITTTTITNMTNFMTNTNTTNATTDMNMITTNSDGDQKRYGYDDNDASASGGVSTAVLDGPELDHGVEQDHQARGGEIDTPTAPTSNSNSATQKSHDDGDDSLDCNDMDYSHGPCSKEVLHPLTIRELTDMPNSDDFDGINDTNDRGLIVSGRRYSLDIIDGLYGAGGMEIEHLPLNLTSTETTMGDQQGDESTADASNKRRTATFFRGMGSSKTPKPNGPRPNTTEGRLQAMTKPRSDLHVKTLVPLRREHVRPSAALASMSAPSLNYTSQRPAPPPPLPIPSASSTGLGKGKSSFFSMRKSSIVEVRGDQEVGDDVGKKRSRKSKKTGTGVERDVTSKSLLGSSADAAHTHLLDAFSSPLPTEWALPTPPELTFAASLPLTCEDGTHISFGSLFATTSTIVIFIRHFWCPLCQDYMTSFKSLVRPEMLATLPKGASEEETAALRRKLVKFVVVSNGAHGMIAKYRRMFGLPFKVYTDPDLKIYRALGMGRDGEAGGGGGADDGESCPARHAGDDNKSGQCNPSSVTEVSGGYVKHGLVGGIAMVMVRAIKVGMPVWAKGGDVSQLGGEFIFGPGLTCTYAHRMQHTRGHAPIEDVLTAARVDVSGLKASSHPEKHDPIHPPELVKEAEGTSVVVPTRRASLLANDLSSPTPGREQSSVEESPEPDHPRPRLSSLKNLTDSISLSRAASVASALSVSLIQKSLHHGNGVAATGVVAPNLAEIQSKRQTRRYSLAFENGNGMMSREEEERWMEDRQVSIERLREKKDMRRGILRSRAVSVDNSGAEIAAAAVASVASASGPADDDEVVVIQPERSSSFEDVSEVELDQPSSELSVVVGDELADKDHREEEEDEMTPTVTRPPFSLNGDWDSDIEEEEEEEDRDITPNPSLSLISQKSESLASFSDTTSSWSRSSAPSHDEGRYVFVHDVVVL